MITSSSFVFGNSTKRFTILDIYDENIILPAKPIAIENKQEAFSIKKNKCCIIS
jgi:hypothetical protein